MSRNDRSADAERASEREDGTLAASGTAPPPRSLPTRLIGGLALGAVGVAIAVKLLSPRPDHVPFGIGGFELGAPVDAARAQPIVAEQPNDPSRRLRFRASALVFDEPAQCVLGATASGQLIHIECTLSPTGDSDEAARRQRRVLATLRQLYGEESRQSAPGQWEWRNSRAFLKLTATVSLGGSTRVENGWAGTDSTVSKQ